MAVYFFVFVFLSACVQADGAQVNNIDVKSDAVVASSLLEQAKAYYLLKEKNSQCRPMSDDNYPEEHIKILLNSTGKDIEELLYVDISMRIDIQLKRTQNQAIGIDFLLEKGRCKSFNIYPQRETE